jgi:hypothetical protein
LNPNLPRWIAASCADHFDTYKGTCFLHFEGTGPRPVDTGRKYWAEFRLDGPYRGSGTAHEENYTVEINVLLCAVIEDNYAYRIQDLQGQFAEAFTNCIPIYRYGNGPQDDDSLVGEMNLVTTQGERVMISNFSMIGPNTQLKQGSIEGHYSLRLRV